MLNPGNKVKRLDRSVGGIWFYQDSLAKTGQEHIVSLLLLDLLHLIRARAQSNADELVIENF
jgi:hypothetical protein